MSGAGESSLFVSSFGSGRPVVCLHGIEAHGLRYVALAERLGAGVRVVAPDLRGHGRSPRSGPWTVGQHIDDLLPLLSSAGAPAVLLGHSYGGFLAWELARVAGAQLAALILVDPAINVSAELARVSTTYEHSIVGHSWADEASAIEELVAARPETGKWAGALDAALTTERRADGRIHPVVAPEAVSACWQQIQRPLVTSTFGGPTLLIEAGRENGQFISPRVVGQMQAQLGAAFEHVVLDATHTIPSDYPDELAAAVAPFLARVFAASA